MAQEIRHSGVSAYVYSPTAAYTPIARLDAGLLQEAVAAHATDLAISAAGKSSSRVFHFHTDLVGAPLEVTDESGELAWAGRYKAWGAVERGEDAALLSRIEQPLRFLRPWILDGLHKSGSRSVEVAQLRLGYPVDFWTGAAGVDQRALKFWFGAHDR